MDLSWNAAHDSFAYSKEPLARKSSISLLNHF